MAPFPIMGYRILNVILLILAVRYVGSCDVFYNEMSCTYTETCEGQSFYYGSWNQFAVPDYDVGIINEETCLEPFKYNGYKLHPVHLVLRTKYDMDNIPSMPPVNNYEDEDIILNIIYSLDLSNNGYSQAPIIRSITNLVKLNLSNNLLTSAVLSNPNVLNALSEIDLSYNRISFIELREDEHPYMTLNIINLSYNILNQLPDGIFGKFANLQKLDLSYNYINILSLTTFENVKHMTHLNLSNNMLIDINSSFFRFKELKILNLSNNRIKDVKLTDFEALRQLKTLDLSSNMIKCINIDLFNAMTLLENLYLSNNQLEMLENNGSSSLQSLIRIDLSNNKLKSLPNAFFKHTKILSFLIEANELEGSIEKGMFEGVNETKLDLSHQFLTDIKDNAFFNLIRLKTLLLNSNNIQTLSKMCFNTLINLQQLDLSNNQIINIDFNKEDLNNLHSLLLKNNYLAEINYEHFQHLNSLYFLDLSTNQISRVEPRSFLSLNNLINLEIYNNPLVGTIETGTFDGLAFIPSLDISRSSMLTTIQNASFNGMIELLELNMSRCKISELQYSAFINTEYIETLDLSYNKLEQFIVNTTDLSRVTKLFLNNNLIKAITMDSLYGLLQLSTIILSQNIINSIDNESFNSLDNLRHVDLSGNENLLFSVAILRENINLNTLILSRVKIRTNFSYISTDNILSNLKLSNIGIENIRELGFGNETHLNFLDLNSNNISKLQIGDFAGMCALLSLDLSFNQLKYIQPGVFKENTELETLNISHNFLSTIEYGIFRGLIHLTVLDMSFNDINDLQTEKFYEVESLSQLIVDHNKIAALNAEDFIGTSLTKLSIGSNPLPCQTLVKLKKQNIPFQITAIRTDEHSNENFNGISCNKGTLEPIFRAEQKEDNLDVINGLRNVLNTIVSRNTELNNTKYTYLEKISNVLEKSNSAYNEKLSNLANLTSDVIAAGNNTNIMFKENNVMLNKIINLLNQTVAIRLNISSIPQKEPIPISSTYIPPIRNSSNGNQTVEIILYINKIKKELEDAIAIEKQNIKRIESKFAMNNNNQNETSSPVNIGRQQLLVSNKDNTKSLFTEICVALILSILVGFMLYKFYKSKMNIRNRFSSSSRVLPAAIENSDL